MADKKISQLTAASTPLAGTEVLPIVQSSTTVKVATNDLTVRNVRANATTGILQVTGPAAASTRIMTVPDANFTAARTDAAQTFTGDQTFSTVLGTTFDTNVAAAGVTLAGVTLSADGTDADIDINITPKGTGEVNLTKVDIDAGTIDGVSIGNSSAASIINVDNIRLDGNTISTVNTNGNLTVTPNGAGKVLLATTTAKDLVTTANGFSTLGNNSEVYAGTNLRTYATSYNVGSGTITLCNVQSRTGANVSGPILRITTSYTYAGGSPTANYAIYLVNTGAGLGAALVSSTGTYPTITTTQISSGATGTADIIGNFNGDTHAMFVVEVFGSVNSWGI